MTYNIQQTNKLLNDGVFSISLDDNIEEEFLTCIVTKNSSGERYEIKYDPNKNSCDEVLMDALNNGSIKL